MGKGVHSGFGALQADIMNILAIRLVGLGRVRMLAKGCASQRLLESWCWLKELNLSSDINKIVKEVDISPPVAVGDFCLKNGKPDWR